ncbi:MAG: 23S rRNA (guanosine(2251)-2'-O)-methyltransferase RlmB [Bacilli bacterium]
MIKTRNRTGKQGTAPRRENMEAAGRSRGSSEAAPEHRRGRPAESTPQYGRGRPAESAPENGRSRPAESAREYGRGRPAESAREYGRGQPPESTPQYGRRRSSESAPENGRSRDRRRTEGPARGRRNRGVGKSARTAGRPRRRVAEGAVEQEQNSREQEFVAGRRAVLEALKGGRSLNKILLQDGSAGGSLNEIVAVAREVGVVIQYVPKIKLDEISPERGHQGIIAYTSAKPYVEIDDLILRARDRQPGLFVLLDGLEDPHNLGSVLRSVDGAGGQGVIIPKRRAVPLTGTVAKASAGALEHVEVARVANVSQALQKLKDAGYWVIGTATDAPQPYWAADYTVPAVLVIGGEGSGMNRLTKERCDMLVSLPMNGRLNSLNAGVAAGILLYEAVRQRSLAGSV